MSENELESWIHTVSGKHFNVLLPSQSDLDILDIAHALSMKCRFSGHTRVFYSVAEHCCRVSHLVSPSIVLHALLHDASEAYLPDVARPIKPLLNGFKDIERRVEEVIYSKWVKHFDYEAVKKADIVLLATEGRDLMGDTSDWYLPETPLPTHIVPWSQQEARQEFIRIFFDVPKSKRK